MGYSLTCPIRNLQILEPPFNVRAKYCKTGTLLRDFNLLLLHCCRRFEVISLRMKMVQIDVSNAERLIWLLWGPREYSCVVIAYFLWLKMRTFQRGVEFKLLCSNKKKHSNRLQGVLISAQYCHYWLVVGGGR